MGYPFVEIDLEKIAANTRLLVELCRKQDIQVVGVTKAFCADTAIAQTMINGGVQMLGDARIQNLRKLREAGIKVPFMLLRIPMPSEADEVVRIADCSLASEFTTMRQLSQAAKKAGYVHNVVLMVDMGDLREGVVPQKILPLVQQSLLLPGVRIQGFGVNFACYAGLIPTPEILNNLVSLTQEVREKVALELPVISGGNSANIELLLNGGIPAEITQLRLGESILLGRETVHYRPIPGAYQDAFILHAEVIEVQEKPSASQGEMGRDAFGDIPVLEDRGIRKRAIVAIGRQDVTLEGLQPLLPGVENLGGSSDHLILDVTDADSVISVGQELCFSIEYGALVHAMVSPYVSRVYKYPENYCCG